MLCLSNVFICSELKKPVEIVARNYRQSEKEEKSDELDENLRFFEENLSESDNIEEKMEEHHEDSENQSSLENTNNGNFGCRYLRLDFFLNLHRK